MPAALKHHQAFERWSQRAGGIVFSTARNSLHGGLRGESGSHQQQTCGTVTVGESAQTGFEPNIEILHQEGESSTGMKTVFCLAILVN